MRFCLAWNRAHELRRSQLFGVIHGMVGVGSFLEVSILCLYVTEPSYDIMLRRPGQPQTRLREVKIFFLAIPVQEISEKNSKHKIIVNKKSKKKSKQKANLGTEIAKTKQTNSKNNAKQTTKKAKK